MRSTRIPPAVTDRFLLGEHAQDGQGGALELAPRILVADGEDLHVSASAAALGAAGFQVDLAYDGNAAREQLASNRYAAIVADAGLSGMDSIGLLRVIRRQDMDAPLVVVTDSAHVGLSAIAVQQGALCYLEKPVTTEVLCATLSYATKLYTLAGLRRSALGELAGTWSHLGDRMALERIFERALDGISIAFQPIISWSNRRVIGHEALLRSSDPNLPDPSSVLAVAERLGRIEQIGRLVREMVARSMARSPAEHVFVNLHPHELLDGELFAASAPLSQFGKRIVIEIPEHTLLDEVTHLESRALALRKLGFHLAMDNLGPGYPGMSSFARLRPDFVKYDQSLVRGVDRNATQAGILAAMTALFGTMNTRVIATGIESIAERDAVVKAGVDLLQGFAFSRPATGYRQPDLG